MCCAAFSAGFCLLPETKAYLQRKHIASQGTEAETRGLVSRSASVSNFDADHPRRSVFGSFSSSSHKKETGVFRAHMIVSPLVAWHEVSDMWHELRDIVTHSVSRGLSRSTSYARLTNVAPGSKTAETDLKQLQQKLEPVSNSPAAAGPVADESAHAAKGSQHAADKHAKHAHAHFADDDEESHTVTGRDDSITAVRPHNAGASHAEGTFWRNLDANGSFTEPHPAQDAPHQSPASIKEAVKAALTDDQRKGPSGAALGQDEARVKFWTSPALEAPSVEQRLRAAWAAVLSPTGVYCCPYKSHSLQCDSCQHW